MDRQRIMALASPLLLLLLLAALVVLRVRLVDRNVGQYVACAGCFDTTVLAADAVLFAVVAALLLLAGLVRPAGSGRILQVLAGLVVVAYAADLVVFRLFNSRLFLSDLSLFVFEPGATWNQLSSGLGGPLHGAVILGGVVLLLLWLALAAPVRGRTPRLLLVAVLAVGLIAAGFTRGRVYVNAWAVDNVFSANLATGEHTPYGPETVAAVVAERPPARIVTGPAEGRGLNVILVLLESWSAWHSRAWGGYEAWTPELDAAARRGTAFADFHAIGFSTDKGLVGILAGQQLWSPFLHPFETPPFHSMWGVHRSLPRAFERHGYHTAFLTSGPLSLYRKGEWLQDLGFDEVEGSEHPSYAEERRYAFDAASDLALYRRAEQWLETAGSPFLLVLETVTTHQPYTDPESGERSLERAMRFADRAFGRFLDDLDASGYFERGILLVVSDHRSMTPVPASELDAWGAAALSRVPAFAIGPGFRPDVWDERIYSQADLVPSFELWLGGVTRLESHQDVMFGQPENAGAGVTGGSARCVFHARFDLRGHVDVHCGRNRGQVRLDGDDSAFVEPEALDASTRADVLRTLAALRLEGLERHRRATAITGVAD